MIKVQLVDRDFGRFPTKTRRVKGTLKSSELVGMSNTPDRDTVITPSKLSVPLNMGSRNSLFKKWKSDKDTVI